MRPLAPWLLAILVVLVAWPVHAAELGVATLVQGGSRVLRGSTWYKVVPGARLEDGDILEVTGEAQIHMEFGPSTVVGLSGPGTIYLEPLPSKGRAEAAGGPLLDLRGGWLKVATMKPGIRLRAPAAEVSVIDGVVVARTEGSALHLFVESGTARLTESSAEAKVRDAKSGEYWSKIPGATLAMASRPPKAFVDAMPRSYFDALPHLLDKFKAKPTLVAEGEISYAEAEPWLAGPQRAVFERRFMSRLRDRTFRNAVAPHVARYPSWDRRLNPQKFAPKPVPQPATRP